MENWHERAPISKQGKESENKCSTYKEGDERKKHKVSLVCVTKMTVVQSEFLNKVSKSL